MTITTVRMFSLRNNISESRKARPVRFLTPKIFTTKFAGKYVLDQKNVSKKLQKLSISNLIINFINNVIIIIIYTQYLLLFFFVDVTYWYYIHYISCETNYL